VITLNQVITNLSNIQAAHGQLNEFFFGENWDFGASGDIKYPAMAVDLEPANLQSSILVRSFRIYVMTQVQKDITDRQEALSDMELIALDIIAQLDSPDYTEWNMDLSNIVLNDFRDDRDAELTGYWFNIRLRILNPMDRCQIPLTDTIVIK